MSHTDVVPVEDEAKWSVPPFGAVVANDRVYGRGASDCKGLLAAQMMAMRLLKRNGVRLEDGLILASGADEEHGGRYGFGWLAENYPEKLDAPFAVNEGGGEPVTAGSLTLRARDRREGPASDRDHREGDERPRVGAMAGDERDVQAGAGPAADRGVRARARHLDGAVRTPLYLRHRATSLPPENVEEIISETEDTNPRLASVLRALSRMTVTPTMVGGGIKSNSVPETISVTCDVRTLPHQDEAYVRQELTSVLADHPRRRPGDRLHGGAQRVALRDGLR